MGKGPVRRRSVGYIGHSNRPGSQLRKARICSQKWAAKRACNTASAPDAHHAGANRSQALGPPTGVCSTRLNVPANLVQVLSWEMERTLRIEEMDPFRPPVLAFTLYISELAGHWVHRDALDVSLLRERLVQ